MNKENFDEKLTTFLRANKPDVPNAATGFEEQLLNATVRRSWSYRLNMLSQPKWRYAFSVLVAAVLIVVGVNRPKVPTQSNSTPTLAATKTSDVNLKDEEIYSFFVESWDGVQGNQNTDVLAEIDLT